MSTATTRLPYRLFCPPGSDMGAAARRGWVNVLGITSIRLTSMSYEDYWQQDASAYTADLRADAYRINR